MSLLLRRGANVNRAYSGKTPLFVACSKGHLATARLLVEKGADPRITPTEQDDLTQLCRKNRQPELVTLLRKATEAVSKRDHKRLSRIEEERMVRVSSLQAILHEMRVAKGA